MRVLLIFAIVCVTGFVSACAPETLEEFASTLVVPLATPDGSTSTITKLAFELASNQSYLIDVLSKSQYAKMTRSAAHSKLGSYSFSPGCSSYSADLLSDPEVDLFDLTNVFIVIRHADTSNTPSVLKYSTKISVASLPVITPTAEIAAVAGVMLPLIVAAAVALYFTRRRDHEEITEEVESLLRARDGDDLRSVV